MSEVKRYMVDIHPIAYPERQRTSVVSAEEFDRVKAERDALQQRLNAADQRIDELSGLLQVLIDNPFRFTETYRVRIESILNPKPQGEDSHEIPGTSGMRLNMLANQGE